jgi:hypothetical protein
VGLPAGVLIEDDQQFQNDRTVMIATATFGLLGKIVVVTLKEKTDVMEGNESVKEEEANDKMSKFVN